MHEKQSGIQRKQTRKSKPIIGNPRKVNVYVLKSKQNIITFTYFAHGTFCTRYVIISVHIGIVLFCLFCRGQLMRGKYTGY